VAQFYSTGHISIFCGVGAGGAPVFLGHGRRAPRQRIRRAYGKAFCDLGGVQTECDRILDGEIAQVMITLSRWKESVLRVLQSVGSAGPAAARGVRGVMAPAEMGTLMVLEAQAYPLWLAYANSARPAYNNAANGAMPAGRHFFAAHLGDVDEIEGGLGVIEEVTLTFECMRVFQASDTSWGLYDENMTGLPSID
jgi:hypothetical protein